jgi:anti-sigma factor RsiW
MNCKNARGLFSLRLDAGLSYEEQRNLTQHLDACPGCAGEFRKLEQTVGLVRDLPEISAPDLFLQNVLRAAEEAERREERPAVRGFGERLREFFGGLEWLSSPRFAPAALALGLIVGVGASVVILRSNHPIEVAQQVAFSAPKATEPALPAAPASGSIVGPSSIPVASGPFEELIAQMMHRLDASSPGVAEDTTGAGDLQWGPTRDAAGIGQQVGANPMMPRDYRRGGRVYVVF